MIVPHTEPHRVRGRRLKDPYANIGVGSSITDGVDDDFLSKWDVFVNVSDSFYFLSDPSKRVYWFPINEVGFWSYAPFFWSKRILDFHFGRGDRIWVHCHAGVHRSPAILTGWLLSRGHTVQEAAAIIDRHDPDFYPKLWERDIEDGCVPRHLDELYRRMDANPTYSLMGILYEKPILDKTDDILTASLRRRMKEAGATLPAFYEPKP